MTESAGTRGKPQGSGNLLRLALPVVAAAAVAVILIIVLVAITLRSYDRHEGQETRHLAEVAMGQIMEDLRSGTLDYTWWDESVRRVVIDLDRDWTSHLWGYYQENFRGNDTIMALAPDDRVIMIWRDSRAIFGGEPLAFSPGLDTMIARARATLVTAPDPSLAWMLLDGEVYAVSVGAITPSDPVWARSLVGERGIGVFARKLAPLLPGLGRDFLLGDLTVLAPDAPWDGEHILLPGPDGSPVAMLVWHPDGFGRDQEMTLLLPLLGGMVFVAALLAVFIHQARRLGRETGQLRRSLEREREMSVLKSRFVSMVSHEFRTPLTSIMASSEMLLHYANRLSEEERKIEIETIESEVDRLTRLIDEVITLGKADTSGLELRPEPVDITDLVERLADRALLAAGGHHTISVHGGGDLGPVNADPQLLELLVGNVLGNAAKYSPGGEPVDVAISREGEMLSIVVIDRGIGIPQEDIASVGQPFVRGGNAGRIGGTGLGLTIAIRAAEAHGGDIAFESEVGRGTKVTIRVSLAARPIT